MYITTSKRCNQRRENIVNFGALVEFDKNHSKSYSQVIIIFIIILLLVSINQSTSDVNTKGLNQQQLHSSATVDFNNNKVSLLHPSSKSNNQNEKPKTNSENLILKSRRSPTFHDSDDKIIKSQNVSIDHDTCGPCNVTTITLTTINDHQIKLLDIRDDEHKVNVSLNNNDNHHQLVERIVNCSHINEDNYRDWFAKMFKNSKSNANIHEIHILSSDSMIVFAGIDLICSSYNCSTLTLFNVSGHQIHDLSRLAYWLSKWPLLEVLDLSNTMLKSIESILIDPNNSGPSLNQLNNNLSISNSKEQQVHNDNDTTSTLTSSSIVLKQLTKLILDYNNISELDFDFIFNQMPNSNYISVLNNSVSNITCNENQRLKFKNQIEYLNLANNSINCDKNHLWLMKQFQSSSNLTVNMKFVDYDQIRCNSAALVDMTWSQRVSVLETRICDYCDCRSLKRTAISVDCHNKNLTSLPDELPLNTKILNLTSNRITSLKIPHELKNWENVTYVHLENNLISSFDPLEFSPKVMRNLAALDIRRNKFREFPQGILEQFINLDQIHLSNNPWICECEATFALHGWLQKHFHKVGDKEEIRCGVSGNDENGLRSSSLQQRLAARVIYKLSNFELCPQEEPYQWMDLINFTLGMAIILILSKVTMDYVYQHRTKRLPHFFKINI